jgi:4-amino-4-deoxy-L-arabinose transferase-like glycosyltransferase
MEANTTERSNSGERSSPLAAIVHVMTASHLRAVTVLVVISLIAFSPGLLQIPPVDRDEPRYAQATKQMNETGDYVDIRFHDGPRYLQPIGIYWLQAAATRITGYGADAPIWVHRLPSLLGATAAVALTYWIALPFVGATGSFVAALLMAASVLLGVEARLAKTDAVLLACTLGAVGMLARAYLGKPVTVLGSLLFWAALAAGILIKGPVIALVVGATTLVLSICDRSVAWLRALRPALGICLLLLLTLP